MEHLRIIQEIAAQRNAEHKALLDQQKAREDARKQLERELIAPLMKIVNDAAAAYPDRIMTKDEGNKGYQVSEHRWKARGRGGLYLEYGLRIEECSNDTLRLFGGNLYIGDHPAGLVPHILSILAEAIR